MPNIFPIDFGWKNWRENKKKGWKKDKILKSQERKKEKKERKITGWWKEQRDIKMTRILDRTECHKEKKNIEKNRKM